MFLSSSGAWIQCLSSNHHSSYHPSVMSHSYVPRLKHISFYFIGSISYSNSIIVLLSLPCWDHRSSWSVSNVHHFLLFLQFLIHFIQFLLYFFILLPQKDFSTFLGQFNIAGNFRPSILFLKRPAIIFQIANIVSFKKPSVSSNVTSEVTISKTELNIKINLWTSCSLKSISSSISLILLIMLSFSNLNFSLTVHLSRQMKIQ